MKEQILELLKDNKTALSVYQINDALGYKTVDELKALLKVLNELEDNLMIYRTIKNNYMLFVNTNLKIGTLIAHKKGFGFVDIEGDVDVFIAQANMNNAIHGDKVVVEIVSKKGIDLEGRILKIVKRELKQMVGEFYREDGLPYILLDDDKVKIKIQIDKDKTMGAVDGHKVIVKITSKLKDNNYRGEIVNIIGHKGDPGVDVLSIAYKYDINDVFSDEVMKEVRELPTEVLASELTNRTDLRNEMIFTIDGDDTKDIDDAISIKKLENGNYVLGVHIADVSYYVKEKMKLDEEAYQRGTSVYLADRVIPMLPHAISNGICSLNPNVDRLTLSCVMEINAKGETVTYDIFESVINSKIQMTYNKVNQILEENETPVGYQEYADSIKMMQELASILRTMKLKRGYIDFDIDESKIIVDDKGKAIDVKLRNRGTGERLIEDFMIVANEAIATHIFFMELPFVYRIHDKPDEEKIQKFLKFIGLLGYKVDGKIKNVTPKTMQMILDQLKEKKEFHILSNLLLRSMQKAIYDKKNIGHFGLASKCYTHFTSPIRRYPDTTVHRLLRTYLWEKKLDTDTIDFWENRLISLTEHVSLKERNSIECEREVDDMKKAEYMQDHIGEEFTGTVSSVMSFGMFVELPNLVEGLVRVDDMKDDFYVFDEETFSIKGNRTKKRYRLGDTVTVIVKSANKDAQTVDFSLKLEEQK